MTSSRALLARSSAAQALVREEVPALWIFVVGLGTLLPIVLAS
jgi:hypothetical protein